MKALWGLILILNFHTAGAETCRSFFELLPYPHLKSETVTGLSENQRVSFHHPEIAALLKPGVNRQSVQTLVAKLYQEGALDIPVDAQGFVAAANVGNHAGNYGRFIWHRDFARVRQGLAQAPALLKDLPLPQQFLARAQEQSRASAHASLRLLEDPQWTEAARANIENPSHHLDPAFGFKSVIWIRRLLEPLQQNRPPTFEEKEFESQWGHKQNDALAAFGLSVLQDVARGEITAADFSPTARENLLYLAAYFYQVQYSKMWDVGAWEEQMGLRTSSIALVSQFMDRFLKGYTGADASLAPFFQILHHETLEPLLQKESGEFLARLQEGLDPMNLQRTVNEGAQWVRDRLNSERLVETFDQGTATRFEDMAILHLLWSPQVYSSAERLQWVQKIQSHLGVSGFRRYLEDWFLMGPAEAAHHVENLSLQNHLAVKENEGYRPATTEEIAQISQMHSEQKYNKDLKALVEKIGPESEAQWTLGDAYLVQFYVELYKESKTPEHLQMAKWHFARLSGLITGPKEFSSEGLPVTAWRMPEAYLPVRVWENGAIQTIYLVSPNSPLNWATAEYIMAAQKILEVL